MASKRVARTAAFALAAMMVFGASAHAQGVFSQGGGHSSKKAPVPSAEAQSKTLDLVREVFRKEYEEAKTAAQKEALAEDLMKRGVESKDATERFVLLRVARDLAAMVGEADLACRAIDEMGRGYEIDSAAMKREALAKAEQAATTPKHFRSVGEQSATLVEEAIMADDYDTARQMIKTALAAAKKARDGDLLDRVTERAAEVEEVAKAKEEVKEALATLEKSPADPKANLAAGRFYCFYRGDWVKGLPMLALGADGAYDVLAKQELLGAKTSEAQVALGDGWWELVEKHQGMAQSQIRAHAAAWYEKALPQLSGLTQMRVKKRLEEMEAAESLSEERHPAKPGETPSKVAAAPKNKAGFAGKWQDTFGNILNLKVDGRNVVGVYKNYNRYGDLNYEGRMSGTLSRNGRTLTAQWARTGVRYEDGNFSGTLVFELAKDGDSFGGTYRQNDAPAGGVWRGVRMKDQPAEGGKSQPKTPGSGGPRPRPGDEGFEPGFGPRPDEERSPTPPGKSDPPRKGKMRPAPDGG